MYMCVYYNLCAFKRKNAFCDGFGIETSHLVALNLNFK